MGRPPLSEFDDPFPAELEDRVLAEIGQGEGLIWSGRPDAVRLGWTAMPRFFFGIFYTAFAVFWVAGALQARRPGLFGGLFPLFGIPFIVVGLTMIASPFWAYAKARRTAYALTDRRVVFFEPTLPRGLSVVSLGGGEITPMERVERADGSGDLTFGPPIPLGYGQNRRPRLLYRRFVGVPHVREVESLVRETLLPRGGGAR